MLKVLKKMRAGRNSRARTRRRTIVFNVDVAKRRKSKSNRSGKERVKGRSGRIAVLVSAVLFCVLCVALVEKGIIHSTGFVVRWVSVSNNNLLSKKEIVSLSGVRVGDSLLSADIETLRERIRSHPDVRDAVITRRIPGRLEIRVYERFPIAAVRSSSAAGGPGRGLNVRRRVVDEDGYVLSSRKEISNQALPYILGMRSRAISPGERLSDSSVDKALWIIKSCRESELSKQLELVSVDVSDPENFIIRSAQISEIRLGNEDLGDRLDLLSRILMQRSSRPAEGPSTYLDLRWKNAAEMPLGANAVSMR